MHARVREHVRGHVRVRMRVRVRVSVRVHLHVHVVHACAYMCACMPHATAHRARLHDAQVIRRVAYGADDVALVVGTHAHHLQEVDGRSRLPW